jgi:hypothetical protein
MYLGFPDRQHIRLLPAQAVFKLSMIPFEEHGMDQVKSSETYAENRQLAQRT